MSTSQLLRPAGRRPSPRPPGGPGRIGPFAARLFLEVAIIAGLFLLYNLGRFAIQGQEGMAREHAELVHRLEATLWLPSEAGLQNLVSSVPHLFELANRYYVTFHFPVMIAFLLWGFLARPRAEYVWARNLLVLMTFVGLAMHVLFPLAPPRMFPEWGFVDTMTVLGPSPYDGASAAVANQYAAMPSLHIGWALLIAVVLARTGPKPLAVLGSIHAVVTVFVVVVTANHWWVDGMVAAGLLGLGLLLLPRPGSPRLPVPARNLRDPAIRNQELIA